MQKHALRFKIIAAMWFAALVSLVLCIALDRMDGAGFGAIVTAFGLLTPALIDAAAVERRRRIPGERPVADDVVRPPLV